MAIDHTSSLTSLHCCFSDLLALRVQSVIGCPSNTSSPVQYFVYMHLIVHCGVMTLAWSVGQALIYMKSPEERLVPSAIPGRPNHSSHRL